ncbi:hypothetical protein Tel_13035 [Candidatus Tenderia electrophaga]|jgi:predicted  nucleic acid-binding Zn-ribbon protein|uniref:Uncharacterized protein n=1 Tax=Candidatus Tenderia electrophaga TaxID=1748243 RepID=A0A0S2TFP6_9GAMM|nr:hypothetical protein Tel_13035 [Candidatus Tenderia electrophaga]
MSDIKAAQKEMNDAYADYAELKKRLKSFGSRREEVKESIPQLTAKIEEAEKHKQKAMADYAAGVVDQNAVTEARAMVESACREEEQANGMLEAIQGEHRKAVDALYPARDRCRDARRRYCQACAEPIEDQLAGDTKIRRQLLDIFAAAALENDVELGFGQGQVDWELLLTNTFPEPTNDEIDKAIERFERNHMQDSKEVAA